MSIIFVPIVPFIPSIYCPSLYLSISLSFLVLLDHLDFLDSLDHPVLLGFPSYSRFPRSFSPFNPPWIPYFIEFP